MIKSSILAFFHVYVAAHFYLAALVCAFVGECERRSAPLTSVKVDTKFPTTRSGSSGFMCEVSSKYKHQNKLKRSNAVGGGRISPTQTKLTLLQTCLPSDL